MSSVKNIDEAILFLMEDIAQNLQIQRLCILLWLKMRLRKAARKRRITHGRRYSILLRRPSQVHHLNRLIGVTDVACIDNLRMDRNTFARLCQLFRQLGVLTYKQYVGVEEQVALFLEILAHHNKNRVVRFQFWRSSHTVSRYVLRVLRAVLSMHSLFLVKPDPVPEDCTDPRWKWFKVVLNNCDY